MSYNSNNAYTIKRNFKRLVRAEILRRLRLRLQRLREIEAQLNAEEEAQNVV